MPELRKIISADHKAKVCLPLLTRRITVKKEKYIEKNEEKKGRPAERRTKNKGSDGQL